MKKVIVAMMLVGMMTPVSVFGSQKVGWKVKIGSNAYYSETMKIKSINRKTDLVTVQNATGFRYTFYGIEDLERGDIVSCIMYTNHTSDIRDDKVMSAKYQRVDLLK